ncbi:MAG: hypothetical protein M1831_003477 [Alyxoria varia]|nr:MAG: hypothetical protein M1831_003477 [Alyxoria varia]
MTFSDDINSISYDAPLSFAEPDQAWRRQKVLAGNRATDLTVPDVDLRGKWALISGSNSGIGRETALRMASWGANLILACRKPPQQRQEPHPKNVVDECLVKARTEGHKLSEIEWWEVDMTDLENVANLGKRYCETGRPLDMLLNNAGMGDSPAGDGVFKTKDGFEIVHQVNFLSHVDLTLHLLPALSLSTSSSPRIVFTTSCFHYLGRFDLRNLNGELNDAGLEGSNYYKNNKLWLQTWLTEFQYRLLNSPIDSHRKVVCHGVHPGYVRTNVWRLNKDTFLPWKTKLLQTLAWVLGIDSQQGSLALLHAATSDEAALGRPGGQEGMSGGAKYFNRLDEADPMPHTKDKDARLRIWRKAAEELKMTSSDVIGQLGGMNAVRGV